MHKKSKNRTIICLGLFVFMLSISSFTSFFASNFDNGLKTSDINTLYNGVSYPFEIRDVYDDENNTKIYTDAYLQTEYFNETMLAWNGTVVEDEVSVVNNTNYKSPSNTGVNMINGTFDDTDNMKANDDSNSEFTSTEAVPAQFIDDITITTGADGGGTIENTHTDDVNYKQYNGVDTGPIDVIDITLEFDPICGGRDLYISADVVSFGAISLQIRINDIIWKNGLDLDFDDELQTGVNKISIYSADLSGLYTRIYYFRIAEELPLSSAELNFTVDLNFDEVDTSKLLALDVSSHHYTNISQTIIGNIYDYDSSSYTEMFSSNNVAETKNDFTDETSVDDYLNASGSLRLQFTGTNTDNDFKLSIDYIRVRFYYKMDIIIYKTFYINGLWRYRFKLIGSLHYTDWTQFRVVDPIPNFYAISESDLTTRWIMQGSDISAIENFTDDINPSNTWHLNDVSQDYFLEYLPDIEDYLLDNYSFYDSSYMSPTQFTDFSFTTGSGGAAGELETNDADFARIDAGITYGDNSFLGEMRPDGDLVTNWNEADTPPHWSKIDDPVLDVPDGGNIRETSSGIHDRWNFDDDLTIPAGEVVTEIRIYIYCEKGAGSDTVIKVTTSFGTTDFLDPEGLAGWEFVDIDGLDFNQAELDGFWMNVELFHVEDPSWIDIEAVYVKVYTSPKYYSVDYMITWDVFDPESIETFYYDYRTTIAYDCDLDIYNWDTTGWLQLESNTGVGFITDSYDLTNPYISISDQIRVRFQTATQSGDFDMELDQIVFEYNSMYNISKKHNNTIPEYAYMQTNTTESISIQSTDYTTHYNLNSGDYFEVDFQTSSDSKIELILLKDGGVNETLTLSPSLNTNFDRHTAKISVDEFVEFDQLKISGTLEDTDNVIIYDVKTYKYTLTGDYVDFYVGSKRDYEVYLTPDIYNLRINEEGHEKVNENKTIPATGVLQYVYTPTETIECRLTLFSLAEEYLQFEDYHVNVSRSLGGTYSDIWLVDTLFYADDGTYIYIEVYDRFDALIYSDFELAKTYIDLYIEVYSLKIRNEATEIVDYELQNTDTGSSKSGTLFSDEIVEYHVKKGDYSLDYTNYEDMYPRECNFELTTHKTISINSTYHTVYIGLFTYDGLGINRDWVRLYINDVRADFGFNVIDSETANLTVKDYFNNTLESVEIDISAYSEYNLYAEVYSLYLLNRFTYNDLIVNITQVDSGIYMNQLIPASSALLYRFIPDINYTISVTYINGTVYSIRTINLTLNSQTESFGIPSTPEEYPKNVYFGVYTTTGLGIDHDLLRFYIDGNRTDFGFNRIEDMIVTLVVRDYFNTTLFNQNVNTSGIYEYNMLITLYSLQIKNLQLQETTVDINTTIYEGTLLSGESLSFMLAEEEYEIGYYDTNNDYKQFTIYLDSNQAYELNRSQICFLIYADQQGNHLVFENYKTYLNGSRAYINNFYREIGDIVGIEIMDRYNISIKNDTLTVVSGINEKYVVLTMYSLKVMSQQLVFNHVNITRDSAYYESEMYWSEWIAPGEIIDFRLFGGYYTINLTNIEDSSFSLYDYTLNGDDVILISSENSLYNVLYNIANVNTTIGNQITNVEINITNQNSAINNTVINIEINLDNINSSLGTMLVDIDTAISNINTSIIDQIILLGTDITNINTSIINQILDIGVDITNINSSIISQLLTLGVDITNINGSIIDQIVLLGVDVTNINTTLYNQMLSIEVDISNLDTSITNQFSYVISNITNVNTTISTQISSLSSDITNVNSTIVNQLLSIGVDITNINTSLSNQILSLEVDITNINSSIIDQILLAIIEIENIETVIDDQTLVMLADISNINSTLLDQMVVLGVDITNINASITNQILSLSVDLTNINASISSLLYYMDVDITSIGNNITLFYASVNTSFINLDTFINNSFIWLESNIFAFNTSISNLVIGVDNSIYLINGTISTMITSLENNLILMNITIDTALFNLNTTLNIIGANITSNYILLNNTINLTNVNINDSRIAIINNLLLINNTISTLIADVYSAVYLINNTIYTAVIDLGTYLAVINNTINGNLSFILSQNEFLTEIYQMTMFSEMLNWTDIGLNISLLTSQIDAWEFINHYRNQSVEIHLRYQDIIYNLTIAAQNTLLQYLPNTGVEYREWSVELQEYVGEWTDMPEDMKVDFGFYETEVPIVPLPQIIEAFVQWAMIILFFMIFCVIAVVVYYRIKMEEVKKKNKNPNSYVAPLKLQKTPYY